MMLGILGLSRSELVDLASVFRAAGVRPKHVAAATAAGAITLMAALALTLTSGWLITRSWQMPPVLELSVAVTAVRALGISRAVFRYLDRLYSHHVALGALARLRSALYAALARSAQPTARGAAHVRLVSDADRVTDFLVRGILPVTVATTLSLVALVATALLSWPAAMVMAVAFVATGWGVPTLVARAASSARTASTHADLVVAVEAALVDRAEFTAAGLDGELAAQVAAASAADTQARATAQRPLATAEGLHTWATGLAALGVLLCAAATYNGNPMWMGVLVLLPLAAFEAHGALAGAALAAGDAARSAAALRAALDVPPAHEPAARTSGGHVRAAGLHTQFGETVWDFDLAPGQRMVVRGASGCGKSQMLETVAGLRAPAAGSVTVPESCRLSAEEAWVFATSVRENLRVAAPAASDALMREVLAAVGFEHDLDTHLADGADSLSAGQRRRLLLARALCSDAEVLLLDEPTEHIDAPAAAALLDMLTTQKLPGARAERTIIVVTHRRGPVGLEVFSAP